MAEVFMAVWHSTILKVLACFTVLQLIVDEIVKVAGNKDPTRVEHVVKESVAVWAQHHAVLVTGYWKWEESERFQVLSLLW